MTQSEINDKEMKNEEYNTLKLVTWNINGIRSRIFNNKTSAELSKKKYVSADNNSSISNLINETQADIICLQETRCNENTGKLMLLEGYNSYFNCSKLEDDTS